MTRFHILLILTALLAGLALAFGQPVLLVGATVIFLAVAGLGVAWPELGLFGPFVCRGDRSRLCVALTFDDGPDARSTPALLDVLRAAKVEAAFPARASWLKDRLLERGWSNSDPSGHEGPDRKTVQKILRGDAVRNDVLQKLADALSRRHGKTSVLDVPQD